MEVWKWVKKMIIQKKKKSNKSLNPWAKTFIQKDTKKPAEDDNSGKNKNQ